MLLFFTRRKNLPLALPTTFKLAIVKFSPEMAPKITFESPAPSQASSKPGHTTPSATQPPPNLKSTQALLNHNLTQYNDFMSATEETF